MCCTTLLARHQPHVHASLHSSLCVCVCVCMRACRRHRGSSRPSRGGREDLSPSASLAAELSAVRTGGRPLPSFLRSLFTIASDPACDDVISWSPSGTSFIVHDLSRFSEEILPQYYKHNNWGSFSRQLNFYAYVTAQYNCTTLSLLLCVQPACSCVRARGQMHACCAPTLHCGRVLFPHSAPLCVHMRMCVQLQEGCGR